MSQIQLLQPFDGRSPGIYDLGATENARLVALGLARNYTAGMDGQDPVFSTAEELALRALVAGAGNQLALRLASAALACNQDVAMTTPPTITLGTAGAASVISGAVTIAWTDARFTFPTRVVQAGATYPDDQLCRIATLDTAATGVAASMNGVLGICTFATEATSFEVYVKGAGKVRLWVIEEDGIPRATAIQSSGSGGSLYRLLYDFGGSRKTRKFIVQFTARFGGISIAGTESLIPWAPQSPKLLVSGDSFGEGTGATDGAFTGFVPRLAERLGCVGTFIASAIGSTGYLANASNAKKGTQERLQTSVIDNAPDIVIWTEGINDSADITAAAADCFDRVKAALPNTLQICFGPFQPRSISGVSTVRSALISVCASRPWMLFIDNTTYGSYAEITGTGRSGAPTGTGNSDWVIGGTDGSDVTHPTAAGHSHIALYRDARIRAALAMA